MLRRLSHNDFAEMFRIGPAELPDWCMQKIQNSNLEIEELDDEKHNDAILQVIRRIMEGNLSVSGAKRKDEWEKGWQENLNEYLESQYDLNSLVPKFIRPNPLLRFKQRYVQTSNPQFEWEFFQIYRYWFFNRFLQDVSSIYEFACGTGYNFVALNQLYPDKQLYGLDWAQSAVDLVNQLAVSQGYNLQGRTFDFFQPDDNCNLNANSGVLTICGLEQVGENFDIFLDYLLKHQPDICVHMEPWFESYDENNLVDYLAILYHEKRGYLKGFYPKLESLERDGRIRILFKRRLYFGSLFHEGYSLIVWKPI